MNACYSPIALLVLSLCLSACTQPTTVDPPLPPAVTPTPPITQRPTLQPLTSPSLTLHTSAPLTATDAVTQELALGYSLGADLVATDGVYIYWTEIHSCCLYRYPLQGGEIEVVATTAYEHRDLPPGLPPSAGNTMPQGIISGPIEQSEDWLLFVDNKYPLVYTAFYLQALNLHTGAQVEILADQQEGASVPAYDISGDWVVWTRLEIHEEQACSAESILVVQNLVTGAKKELSRVCVDDNYMWDTIGALSISGHYVVATQLLSDAKGRGSRIYLFDMTTGTAQVISGDNRYNMMPQINGEWIAWKVYPDSGEIGPDSPDYTMIFNWRTQERRPIMQPYGMDEPFIAAGRWLYWDKLNSEPWETIYDLATAETITFTTELQPGELTLDWQINGNTVVWSTQVDDGDGDPRNQVYIRWRTSGAPQGLATEH